MNIRTIILNLNKNCDDLELREARRLIELHIESLSNPSYERLLNPNAKALIKHIIHERSKPEHKELTRVDRLKIREINQYCSDFDISMLKRILKGAFDLIQREDVQVLLNKDAKTVLDNMGALLIKSK